MTQQEDIVSMDNSGAHTDQKNFDEKTKLSHACPVCHGYKVHRTQRSALERWFSRLRPGHRVYLCHECQHRFWAPKNRVPPPLSASKGHPSKGHPSKGHPSKGHPSKGHPSKGHPSKGHLIRSRSPSASQRFAAWLYRKHGLSIGVFFLLFLTFSAAVFFVWSAMSAL